jgi:site-specific DNA-methyltransferase (cytosine-N4-specific)
MTNGTAGAKPRRKTWIQAQQCDLFSVVASAYADRGALANTELYDAIAVTTGLDLEAKQPIGRAGVPRSVWKRQVRWQQQTLKALGVLERVPGERGAWRLAASENGLSMAKPGVALLGFSTNLGLAIWGDCSTALAGLDQPITLIVSSPPYPIQKARQYGGTADTEAYIDFICRAIEPAIKALAPGGSLCLNVSNDVFEAGRPSRSLYLERLTLAIADRFGMSLMDRLIWHNPSKPPGPVAWASKQRVQLNVSWEPVLWFTNDPTRISADNRRVLEAHTMQQLALMKAGGESRETSYGDGAYRIRPGAFASETKGHIPRNILTRGHRCADTLRYRDDAMRLGLPVHGAMQPLSIPDFLIRFLSKAGDLVVDPFGGTPRPAMDRRREGSGVSARRR